MAEKPKLGLVIDKIFHDENHWCSATTYYLVEAIKYIFDCFYIENQSDYEDKIDFLDVLISMEPGWAAPILKFNRTNSLKQKLSEIPSYILYSDPHANLWREEYFFNNNLDYILSYYYNPFKYHFKHVSPKNLVHFPWAIPDHWVNDLKINFNGNAKISCFGGHKSEAYSLRNWCREFSFVESYNNSGVENKAMTDSEYIKWLGQKDAAIAAGSDDVRFRLTVPKYFEIPAQGVLLFRRKQMTLNCWVLSTWRTVWFLTNPTLK